MSALSAILAKHHGYQKITKIPTLQEMIQMIRSIISTLSLLWILLVGTPTPDKSTILNKKMSKQEKRTYMKVRFNLWIERNFGFIALAAILILLLLFVVMCFWFVGVSAVESGKMYNHFEEVI